MLAFLEDIGIQLILLIAAGIIWVIGKVWSGAQQLRETTRRKVDEQERRRKLEFEERSPIAAPEPEPMVQLAPSPRPIQRPPRTKKKPRVVRRRLVRKSAATGATAAPPLASQVIGVKARLRDPARIREAIVLREILGPPLALRRRPSGGRTWLDRS